MMMAVATIVGLLRTSCVLPEGVEAVPDQRESGPGRWPGARGVVMGEGGVEGAW